MSLFINRCNTIFSKLHNFVKCQDSLHKYSNIIGVYNSKFYSNLINPLQGKLDDYNDDRKITTDVISAVNETQKSAPSRTFAVVQICGKQFKITSGDAIIIEGYWPPTTGDKIRLDKVLVAGSKDFSLIGTPLVENGLVNINATVIEKTLSHTKTHFRKKRRKQYMRINFYRCERTVLRINDIKIGELDEDV